MSDLKKIMDVLMQIYTTNFKIFDCNLNFLTIYIGLFLIGLAVFAVCKLFL